jgi:hypothetical protein
MVEYGLPIPLGLGCMFQVCWADVVTSKSMIENVYKKIISCPFRVFFFISERS